MLRIAGSLLQRHTTSSQLVRALRSHTRHLATLARALQHIGRAPKTIHLLDYCNAEHFRRRILAQLNRPLGSDHTTLTGRYRVLLPAPLHDRRAYRFLNTSQDATAA